MVSDPVVTCAFCGMRFDSACSPPDAADLAVMNNHLLDCPAVPVSLVLASTRAAVMDKLWPYVAMDGFYADDAVSRLEAIRARLRREYPCCSSTGASLPRRKTPLR